MVGMVHVHVYSQYSEPCELIGTLACMNELQGGACRILKLPVREPKIPGVPDTNPG